MSEFIHTTLQLYRDAGLETWRSLTRNWLLVPAVLIMAVGLFGVAVVTQLFGMDRLLSGFVLGIANVLVVGTLLGLLEQAVLSSRRMVLKDLWSVVDHYFWDVLTIGFLVWVPLQLLELGLQTTPYGPVIISATHLLVFLVFNPVPELVYQGRTGASLETLKDSYEFVLENWIEWFFPLAVVCAPLGVFFFFAITSYPGRVGLDFFQLLGLPFAVLSQWFHYLGLSSSLATILLLLLTPLGTVLMMLFRGHLYKALSGSSHRQRAFLRRAAGR